MHSTMSKGAHQARIVGAWKPIRKRGSLDLDPGVELGTWWQEWIRVPGLCAINACSRPVAPCSRPGG
eukprot:1146737-Pelagomonas_calceolata.AAC.4